MPHDQDLANSSVKTFEAPSIRLAPRPLNFVYQIQQEREMQQLGTADGAISVDSKQAKGLIKAQYSTDEQEGTEGANLNGTIRITDSQLQQYGQIGGDDNNTNAINVSHFDSNQTKQVTFPRVKKPSRKNSSRRKNDKQDHGKPNFLQKQKFQEKLEFLKVPNERTTLKIKNMQQTDYSQNSNFNQPGSNHSRFSNVMTLKPSSPTPSRNTNGHEMSQVTEQEREHMRNLSADTRMKLSLDSAENRRAQKIMVESSEASTTHFIELPNNPYMQSNYVDHNNKDLEITQEEEIVRKNDPETFLYLMLLKKMKKNPQANVTKDLKQEIISEAKEDFGALKPLKYKKLEKPDQDNNFKQAGVIQEDSFQFDQLKRRRKEYMEYCLKKINAAIHDETMSPKDQNKSPLNV